MEVNKDDFVDWKNNPVTKRVFQAVQDLRDSLNVSLTSANLIMQDNFEKTASRTLGQREGLDTLLQIHAADIVEDTDDAVKTSGTQSSD